MAYTAWSVVFGEQPTAAKWNQLGENDAGFKTGANIDNGAIVAAKLATPPSRFVAIEPVVAHNSNPSVTTFVDLDVSAYVSSTATAVLISLVGSAATAGRFASVRPNGSSNTSVATQAMYMPVANVYNHSSVAVKLDSNKIFEWAVNNADVTDIYISVLGYWELVA